MTAWESFIAVVAVVFVCTIIAGCMRNSVHRLLKPNTRVHPLEKNPPASKARYMPMTPMRNVINTDIL